MQNNEPCVCLVDAAAIADISHVAGAFLMFACHLSEQSA
jgi:hypothetical protein